jgi:hypothetical protein
MRTLLTVLIVILFAVQARADDSPKRLTAEDLSVQTHKWDGKTIRTTVSCFFADKDEYRCIAGWSERVTVRIDFVAIEPESMKSVIEDKCDAVAKARGNACKLQATFVYLGNERQEHPDGSVLMLIMAENGKGTFAPVK